MLARLTQDDLPLFEANFKELLNENAIRWASACVWSRSASVSPTLRALCTSAWADPPKLPLGRKTGILHS